MPRTTATESDLRGATRLCPLVGVGALAILLTLAGCGREVAAPELRYRESSINGLEGGVQGSRSDLVFANEAASRSVWSERPELDRRDALVNIHRARALTAADEWPTEARPSLDRARYLYLRSDRDARDVLYFRDTRPGYHGPGRYHRRGYHGGY